MKWMSAPLLVLALLVPAASAAPAPDRATEAFRAMKAKLPEVVKEWGKWNALLLEGNHQARLRLARQVSPTEAKVTVLLHVHEDDTQPEPLTIYLRYYDCTWTSTRFEGRWKDGASRDGEAVAAIRRLMLAIDELGEK